MKMTCTRPEWSEPSNDYCPCDDPTYDDILKDLEAGKDPCEECTWWEEV